MFAIAIYTVIKPALRMHDVCSKYASSLLYEGWSKSFEPR